VQQLQRKKGQMRNTTRVMPRVTIGVELRGSSVWTDEYMYSEMNRSNCVAPTGAHSGYLEMSHNENKKPLHALGKELEGAFLFHE
jgi:hypothetical protein